MSEDAEDELPTSSADSRPIQPYIFEPTQSFNNLTPSSSFIPPNATVETVLNQEDDCNCGKCIHHHTGISPFYPVCCLKSLRILNKMDGDDLNCKCITDSSAFKIMCLNEDILRVIFRRTLTIRKKRRKSTSEMFDDSARRWTAYSQFIFWIYNVWRHPWRIDP